MSGERSPVERPTIAALDAAKNEIGRHISCGLVNGYSDRLKNIMHARITSRPTTK
jgi:hypothetical protein